MYKLIQHFAIIDSSIHITSFEFCEILSTLASRYPEHMQTRIYHEICSRHETRLFRVEGVDVNRITETK